MKPSDLINAVMAHCGQYNQSGVADNTTVSKYKALLPNFCDMAQKELILDCKFKLSFSTTLIYYSGEGYRAVSLPSNFMQIEKIIDSDGKNWADNSDFAYVDGLTLYVTNAYSGTLTIMYLANSDISDLDTNFIVPISYRNAIVFYCVAMLLFDQNTAKAGFFQEKYEEQKRKLKQKDVKTFKKVNDYYA